MKPRLVDILGCLVDVCLYIYHGLRKNVVR